MISNENKTLAEIVAYRLTGRHVKILWARPGHVRKALGLAERATTGPGAVIFIDPNNRDWLRSFVHEVAHVRLHWSTLPRHGQTAVIDWRSAMKAGFVDPAVVKMARRREEEAEEWADEMLSQARAYIPVHTADGRRPTQAEAEGYALRALLRVKGGQCHKLIRKPIHI